MHPDFGTQVIAQPRVHDHAEITISWAKTGMFFLWCRRLSQDQLDDAWKFVLETSVLETLFLRSGKVFNIMDVVAHFFHRKKKEMGMVVATTQ